MTELKELWQSADWKAEKHVPVIETQEAATKGEFLKVKVIVGKGIPHPNKTEHHIRWIALYFLPKGENFPYQIGKIEFTSHGESTQGPDTSTVYTNSVGSFELKTDKAGTFLASAYCNIHGLWQSSKEVAIK